MSAVVSERLPRLAKPAARCCAISTCRRPLPPSERGRKCSTCRAQRRLGRVPSHRGRCLFPGCTALGRRRSGLCGPHCRRRAHIRRKTRRVLREIAGVDMPLEYVLRVLRLRNHRRPEFRRAFGFVFRVLRSIDGGRLAFHRLPASGRRGAGGQFIPTQGEAHGRIG